MTLRLTAQIPQPLRIGSAIIPDQSTCFLLWLNQETSVRSTISADEPPLHASIAQMLSKATSRLKLSTNQRPGPKKLGDQSPPRLESGRQWRSVSALCLDRRWRTHLGSQLLKTMGFHLSMSHFRLSAAVISNTHTRDTPSSGSFVP